MDYLPKRTDLALEEDFELFLYYTERFKQFLLATSVVAESKQRAIFLSSVGKHCFALLINLLASALPVETLLDTLFQTLQHCVESKKSKLTQILFSV